MGEGAGKFAEKHSISSFVTIFLWDMPALVENPHKFKEIIHKSKTGSLSSEEKLVIDIFKRRILRTKNGKTIYKQIFGEEAPDFKESWITPPDKLYAKLKEKLGNSVL